MDGLDENFSVRYWHEGKITYCFYLKTEGLLYIF